MAISPYIKKIREKIGKDMLLIPAVSAIITDDHGRVLLQRASDNGKWQTIGGSIEPCEEPADAVVREVFEETGLVVVPERITGVNGSPLMTYRNGDQITYVAITFLCRVTGGKLCVNDDESLELKYFSADELPDLGDQMLRVRQALSGQERAQFAPVKSIPADPL